MAPRGFSRRSVLRGLAAGLAGTAVIGTGAAAVPTGEYVVACRSPTAVRAARARATGLRHAGIDLGRFGTLVVGRFPAAALEGLRNHPGVRYVAPDATVYAVTDDTDGGRVVYESTATSGTATSEVKFGGEHTYTATVTATDATGLTDRATQTITAV